MVRLGCFRSLFVSCPFGFIRLLHLAGPARWTALPMVGEGQGKKKRRKEERKKKDVSNVSISIFLACIALEDCLQSGAKFSNQPGFPRFTSLTPT